MTRNGTPGRNSAAPLKETRQTTEAYSKDHWHRAVCPLNPCEESNASMMPLDNNIEFLDELGLRRLRTVSYRNRNAVAPWRPLQRQQQLAGPDSTAAMSSFSRRAVQYQAMRTSMHKPTASNVHC